MNDPALTPVVEFAQTAPTRVWPVFAVYFSAIILQIVVEGVLLVTLSSRQGWDLSPDALLAAASSLTGLLGSALVGLLIMAGTAIGAALLSRVPWRKRLRMRAVNIGLLNLVIACAGVLGVGLVLQGLDGQGWIPHSPTLEAIDAVVSGLSGFRLFAAIAVIGFAPGFAEEILFRGYIQTRLSERWGIGRGILLTSVMFGVMHFDLVQGTYAMVIGILLGFIAERTGSIVSGMMCHAVNNTVATLMSATGIDFDGRVANELLLAIGIAVAAAAAIHLWRHLPHSSWNDGESQIASIR